MGILSGNPKDEPMHYGEVYGVWAAVHAMKGMVVGHQTLRNHAGDQDLIKFMDEAIDMGKQHIQEMETLLKENGVGLPPTPPERPKAELEDIPTGARAMDPEIAATLSADTAAGLVTCSQAMGQCIREDIASMFGQFHTQKATFAMKLLRLNKEKGWLVPPPLHQNGAEEQ
ncbi:Protein of unknown function [Oceanobacillus limi]|uniref:DUF3231 family protein n=1 Tax=Oceanobacillus limi TaxID=930131 RepID=A0A1I0F715_9BACI|nr:DUF3231 family protein [Oceanobacillus limi]SET53485.1 Protein of unknown function [Oceanobacillus limi]